MERLAESRPDLDRVRLDHAAVLLTLSRDDEADAVFRDLRRQEILGSETRRAIEGYLERIRARQRWQLDFDLGVWRDSNVNNATEAETVAIPAFGGLRFALDQRPVRAWVARTGGRLRWREPLTDDGRLYLETHASAARNTAIGARESAERPAKYPPITAGDYMVEKFASQASGEEWSDEDSRKFGTADTESRFTQ